MFLIDAPFIYQYPRPPSFFALFFLPIPLLSSRLDHLFPFIRIMIPVVSFWLFIL